MPAATTEPPSVTLSFANNFWGKDDAGVSPLLERMQGAKQTCDELKYFYSARAALEDEYAKKLLNLSRKPLGHNETGGLKTSLDTMRGELEQMGKQHQSIAAQMKTELEEPLAAFAGGMKERRKIVQTTVEKLLKTKVQQTQQVNKTRDKYEQECLKIKGYLAQGHMVMGQEERRNKAKLEKTQISLATSNTEYENAVKALEDTTMRWNREWKAAADKFQDLEEERLDFTKSSLWTFANVASTVCVSDDASCEKIRLSLEKMDVEKDITYFITERGTGQEIPDAPKYINFCRGDINDSQSEASEDDNYSVAQFPRSINPAFRSSSPQPSTFESHHDPESTLANNLAHREPPLDSTHEAILTPQKMPQPGRQHPQQQQPPPTRQQYHQSSSARQQHQQPPPARQQHQQPQIEDEIFQSEPTRGAPSQNNPPAGYDTVPHDPYPMDGMTMLCRTGPPSDRSSNLASARPSSRDSRSECSNPTSLSSMEPPSGPVSPIKPTPPSNASPEKRVLKKRSGFFQNHSPFRRKSTKGNEPPATTSRNTWHASKDSSSSRRPPLYSQNSVEQANLADPIDANASLALGVGQNVLPVQDSSRRPASRQAADVDENDPIAQALAELKGIDLKGASSGKESLSRQSADRHYGISTPQPGNDTAAATAAARARAGSRAGTASNNREPPPSYSQPPVTRLGVPPPAVTSKAMKQASAKVAEQTRSVYGDRDRSRGGNSVYGASPTNARSSSDLPRAASPAPTRSASPQPSLADPRRMGHRSASPNPQSPQAAYQTRAPSQASFHRGSEQGFRGASPREASPSAYSQYGGRARSIYGQSNGSDMSVQLAPTPDDGYGSARGRDSRAMGLYEGDTRQRSQSLADPSRQYTPDGRAILHYARALYMYQAAIPEELGFSKGDYLAVLRHQDDGWWEAEVHGGNGRIGLVPSNYLQPC